MSDAKMKNEKDVSYTIHGFPIVMQIWAYEVMPKLGERFGERVVERSPRLLCWNSTKQPQQRTYDAFFKDVQLHVHATLRPTEAERDLPYIANLVSFSDRPVQFLDDLARRVVSPQFHEAAPASGGDDGSDAGDEHDNKSGAGAEDVDTSASDGHHTLEGNGEDGAEPDNSGESGGDHSSETSGSDRENEVDASGRKLGALPTQVVAPSTYGVQGTRGGATITREDVEGMLYDQGILFEMRLRTVKLEIMQHVTEEFAKLRDFISTLVPPSSGTSTSAVAPVVNEPNLSDTKTGKAATYRARMTTSMLTTSKYGEGGDEQTPEDDNRTEEGDMQDMNGETVPTLPTDDEEGPSTHDVTEVDGICFFPFTNLIPRLCGVVHTEPFH
ncbi:Hypothetical predicted protein [Olea europaea subsp. europaea]|uniref:Uncharacterized protein n=1 Tax=Olea europaea subsp. europaea TaxID=158383 RepID=A0A8S0R0J4_OLEEU|nr:Hypothetical predicted protein [Olea europaea subsp. europaea]